MQCVVLYLFDQFCVFQVLCEKGQGEEVIVVVFFVMFQIVKQCFKFVFVVFVLFEVYVEDGMMLEQLMVFIVNLDYLCQEQVWDVVKNFWNKEFYVICCMLMEILVWVLDCCMVFVGVDVYEVVGGVVLCDFFQGDDGGWFENFVLFDWFVVEKFQVEIEVFFFEGWKWIEVGIDLFYGYSYGLWCLVGDFVLMIDEDSVVYVLFFGEYCVLEE